MTTLRFKQGDVLFRQGDESDRVLWISRGEIEVLRTVGSDHVVIGHVGEGDWLGEMGVIENRPHGATARAASDCEIQALTAREFLDRVSKDPRLARGLLLRLCAKLRKVDDEVTRDLIAAVHERHPDEPEGTPAVAVLKQAATISLSAQTDVLRDRMGSTPIEIGHLPYVVGRVPAPGEPDADQPPDLLLEDEAPFHLSREHFKIIQSGGQFLISDLGSHLGTIVNGQAIGHHFTHDTAVLQPGKNRILAGGLSSPFKFALSVG